AGCGARLCSVRVIPAACGHLPSLPHCAQHRATPRLTKGRHRGTFKSRRINYREEREGNTAEKSDCAEIARTGFNVGLAIGAVKIVADLALKQTHQLLIGLRMFVNQYAIQAIQFFGSFGQRQ
ncbi:MAG: hypothetical protein JWQ10_3354, partial [Herbaspirillum sp.]|nr:hypothetical protein [Herbaspirillum sp.]